MTDQQINRGSLLLKINIIEMKFYLFLGLVINVEWETQNKDLHHTWRVINVNNCFTPWCLFYMIMVFKNKLRVKWQKKCFLFLAFFRSQVNTFCHICIIYKIHVEYMHWYWVLNDFKFFLYMFNNLHSFFLQIRQRQSTYANNNT